MKKLANLLWILMIGVFHCCQPAVFQPDSIDQDYLTFGKGGGMTSQVITYYLLEDGEVYRQNSLDQKYEHLGRLKKSNRKACFDKIGNLSLDAFGCDSPGNIYYFLSLHAGEEMRKCTWGKEDATPPEDIVALYQYAQELINDL